jgi:secreted PhoX family phosphatase
LREILSCDFIGYLPLPQDSHSSTRGLLGVNHESTVTALMVPGWDGKPESTTLEMVDIGIAAHGFSIVEVVRESHGGWTYVRDSAFNRRITGATPMTLGGPAAGHPLLRTSADPSGLTVLGTLNNCAGGVTPWSTVLTGEENIWLYFTGKVEDVPDEALRSLHLRYRLGAGRYVWGRYHDRFDLRQEPHEPNRFGWVVEIDPYDPKYSSSRLSIQMSGGQGRRLGHHLGHGLRGPVEGMGLLIPFTDELLKLRAQVIL